MALNYRKLFTHSVISARARVEALNYTLWPFQQEILDKGINSLKAITGKRPLGYRSPSWEISPNSLKLLLERDFIYDSSTMADDFTPYKCRIGDKASITNPFKFGRESRLLEIPVAWNLDDWPLFEYQESSGLSAPSKVYEFGLETSTTCTNMWKTEFSPLHCTRK